MSVSPANQPYRQVQKPMGTRLRAAACMGPVLAIAAVVFMPSAFSQDRAVPDTYTAVTAHMMPAGVELKADILQWSDDAARAAAIEAMQAEEPSAALTDLPTLGVIWRSGSAVGTAVKYAYRSAAADGSEQVVLVTDKPVGATSFNPWTVEGYDSDSLGYSVLELRRPASGQGAGTMSLAAEVVIDADAALVSLRGEPGAPELLVEVELQPKPYWARDGG